MKLNYTILVVDDHPIITSAYTRGLKKVEEETSYTFMIKIAHTLDEAAQLMEGFSMHKPLDLLLVDLKLPAAKKNNWVSGEDLAIQAKQRFSNLKIIIATTFNNNYRIHNIVKNVNPDGFLVKNDITPEIITKAIQEVIENPPYYTKSIVKSLRKYVANEFILDKIDRDLLYQLSLGIKTKDLTEVLPLSLAAIERRKKHLKEIFGVDSNNDKDLLQTARELGFI